MSHRYCPTNQQRAQMLRLARRNGIALYSGQLPTTKTMVRYLLSTLRKIDKNPRKRKYEVERSFWGTSTILIPK